MSRTVASIALVAGVIAVALAALLYGLNGDAQEPDPLLATVNGAEVRASDLDRAMEDLPPPYNTLPREQVEPLLLQQVILDQLLLSAAEGSGVSSYPPYQEAVEREKQRLKRDFYLDRRINREIDQNTLEQEYQEYLEENPPQQELKARHILVEERETAEKIIDQLQAGGDFAELAQAKSTGPSGQSGGDLGWFTRDVMVPEFAEAAFALEPGQITQEPVETQFGWHVIEVTDSRQKEAPPLEEIEPQLRERLAREIGTEVINELRAEAEIELTEKAPAMPEEAPGQAPAPPGGAPQPPAVGDGR